MTQQPYLDPLGSLVKRIREDQLQLSQTDLAWLAKVSRGTISNLETGRVTPDIRTWHRIRTALVLPPLSVEQVRDGIPAPLVIRPDAAQGITQAILDIRDQDPELGRRTAERWLALVGRLTENDGHPWPAADAELNWLADEVASMAPPGKIQVIHDALRSRGWIPAAAPVNGALPSSRTAGFQQVQTLVSTVSDVVEQLRAYRDQAQGFERLSERVQDLLAHGLVVNSDVTSPESSPGVSIVSLIVMNETDASLTAQHEAYDAALRWREILAVATHIVEKQAPRLSPEEIIAALRVGLDAQSPVEVNELLPVARRGDPRAMYKLARLFRKSGRPDEAERWFRRAAEAGHPGALFNLGNLAYEDGRQREAVHWLTEASKAGHPNAMYILWVLLRNDDPQAAEKWLREAADVGNRNAMYQMWILHREDDEYGRDNADQWLRRAANYGHRQALTDLSKLVTEHGSEDEAARWLHRAAEEGDTGALSRYEIMLYEKQLRQQAASRNAG